MTRRIASFILAAALAALLASAWACSGDDDDDDDDGGDAGDDTAPDAPSEAECAEACDRVGMCIEELVGDLGDSLAIVVSMCTDVCDTEGTREQYDCVMGLDCAAIMATSDPCGLDVASYLER